MPRLFVLMNHPMTSEQEREARDRLKVGEIVLPPKGLASMWSNVSPEKGEREIISSLRPVFEWLEKAEKGDFVLVQGEFGVTFTVVDWCMKMGLVPIYATTRRLVHEEIEPDGTTRRLAKFKHVRFRKYTKVDFFS